MSIPIQNIYYILCYAWDRIDEKDAVSISKEEFGSIPDLLAKVLVNGISRILKRGLDKGYLEVSDEVSGVKGKLDFSSSIKRNLFARQKAVCTFDELSPDNVNNQILLSSIKILIGIKVLAPGLKLQLRGLIPNFANVSVRKITPLLFKEAKIYRNNRHYDFPLKVCQLIIENSIPAETAGTYKFHDFQKNDGKMSKIFEQFVLNFYRREQKVFKVTAGHISWQLNSEFEVDMGYIPNMRTDITLKNSIRKIIIDTKYYNKTLTSFYGKESLHASNLYQIASYLINQKNEDPITESVTGILLYPQTQQALDLRYTYFNHIVKVKTVDLYQDWQLIHNRLQEIIG